MLRKLFSTVAAAAVALTVVAPVAAEARYYDGGRYEHVRHDRDRGEYGGRDYYRGDRGHYRGDRGYYRDRGRYYGGRDSYRGRCRDRGTGGTILGAIAGGLLGNELGNGRYDRGDGTTGAIVGAGIGALAGRSIDRDC